MSDGLIRRAIVIVMDSCGVGAAPDAADYGDEGSDTVGHTATAVGGLDLPNFRAAGLGNLHGNIEGVPAVDDPTMAFGRMAEASSGKDSTTGHWEMAGIVTTEAQATFTDTGFPDDLVNAVESEAGVTFVGNVAASGTEIIERLGEHHLSTGELILYTSGDSVFQIAAHLDIVPIDELYRVCEIARRHCNDYNIGRVIARPFKGSPGSFERTYQRQDFSMPPHSPTVLDQAKEAGLEVYGVGKIEDLFAGRGLTDAVHTEGDRDGLERTIDAMRSRTAPGVIFTNLVDLDMVYGHRENPPGYAEGLALIDSFVPALVDAMNDDDLLIFSADHGNDPTDGDTDHTREFVPLLVSGFDAAGIPLGDRDQYCDVAATIAEGLGIGPLSHGTSFLSEIT